MACVPVMTGSPGPPLASPSPVLVQSNSSSVGRPNDQFGVRGERERLRFIKFTERVGWEGWWWWWQKASRITQLQRERGGVGGPESLHFRMRLKERERGSRIINFTEKE